MAEHHRHRHTQDSGISGAPEDSRQVIRYYMKIIRWLKVRYGGLNRFPVPTIFTPVSLVQIQIVCIVHYQLRILWYGTTLLTIINSCYLQIHVGPTYIILVYQYIYGIYVKYMYLFNNVKIQVSHQSLMGIDFYICVICVYCVSQF